MARRSSERIRLRDAVQITRAQLPVPLSDGELLAYADRAGRLQSELDDKGDALKAHSKAARAEMDEIARERNEALRRVRERVEQREIEVEISYVFAENAVRTVRRDTGEVVSERAMTWDERQERLFDVRPAAAEGTES